MSGIRYVLLDPTGNLTCLVLDPVPPERRGAVTAALMDRCEQVGYLTAPRDPRARARLQMMGGEFCGNASMATAAWLASGGDAGDGRETEMLLEVSGAESLVPCTARREGEAWRASAGMPLPRAAEELEILGIPLSAVFFPGMAHLIYEGAPLTRERAEELIRAAAERLSEPAVGLMQWREAEGRMTPLVLVRESGTLVWETACGSGTTAVACRKTRLAERSLTVPVSQPGGTLEAETEWRDGEIRRAVLRGKVRIGPVSMLKIDTGESR